ncbi:hypothetical protein L1987_12051 [Smallanthus sonchifolius]|uniref:Uncharacterized protein n=1 Tax=Smallanthus sonchifolius TaxID=185202 RepID=A0ACB9JE83_9ASTR|nr:hypothetical protein L1987_12051 [Smallanthus sonchifolius]
MVEFSPSRLSPRSATSSLSIEFFDALLICCYNEIWVGPSGQHFLGLEADSKPSSGLMSSLFHLDSILTLEVKVLILMEKDVEGMKEDYNDSYTENFCMDFDKVIFVVVCVVSGLHPGENTEKLRAICCCSIPIREA